MRKVPDPVVLPSAPGVPTVDESQPAPESPAEALAERLEQVQKVFDEVDELLSGEDEIPANLREVRSRPGEPDPLAPRGIPLPETDDAWDQRKPTRDEILSLAIPLPTWLASGDDEADPATIRAIQFDASRRWIQWYEGTEDIEIELQIHEFRKVDLDRDGRPEVVMVVGQSLGGTGLWQHILVFRQRHGRLTYIGEAAEGPQLDNYGTFIFELRRLGRCVEAVAENRDQAGPRRMVYAWSRGTLRLAEYAWTQWVTAQDAEGYQENELQIHHLRADALMKGCKSRR